LSGGSLICGLTSQITCCTCSQTGKLKYVGEQTKKVKQRKRTLQERLSNSLPYYSNRYLTEDLTGSCNESLATTNSETPHPTPHSPWMATSTFSLAPSYARTSLLLLLEHTRLSDTTICDIVVPACAPSSPREA
jgi:hypothetical protein